MSKRLVVDTEPWRRTDFHFDEAEDKVTLNTVQDAEPIVEENKRKMNAYGCLLYTSPSPRDRTRSRMPSSA